MKSRYSKSPRNRLMEARRKYVPDVTEQMIQQHGTCPICGLDKKLVIDHNHSTGKIRGLICHTCNRTLGMLRDDVDTFLRAAEYIHNDGF